MCACYCGRVNLAQTTLTPTPPLSFLEIDLGAVSDNLAVFRERCGDDAQICGVVKKNAYGHGAVTIAHRLVKAGCDMLGVFSPAEAEELGAGAVTAPLLLLYPLRHLTRTEGVFRAAVAGRLHLTVQDREQVGQLDEIGRTYAMELPVHLYVDTGMSRAGLTADELPAVIEQIQATRFLKLAGVMSHLSTADSDAQHAAEQAAAFDAVVAEHAAAWGPGVTVHLANTFGSLQSADYVKQMIRPGLGLYGVGVDGLEGDAAAALRPALRWVSRVISAAAYPRGAAVGYGATHKLRKHSVLGLVPVGYGDGYPLALSNRASVRVRHGETWYDAPVRGRVNMDQISVDLTELAKATGQEPADLRGLEVEVVSRDAEAPNTISRLAELAKSHAYELLCRLPREMPRRYLQ